MSHGIHNDKYWYKEGTVKMKPIFIISIFILIFSFIEMNTRDFHQNKCDHYMKKTKCAVTETSSQEAEKAESTANAYLTNIAKLDVRNKYTKSNITKTTVKKETANLVNQYDGREVFKVSYSSEHKVVNEEIVIFVDAETFEVIGSELSE